ALILIHGAPGSTFDWIGFAMDEKIYNRYRLLIVDRPGYGATKPRGVEKSIIKQAEQLLEVLKDEKQAAYILGHSYGAPVAVIMGALSPEKIAFICGASGQYDPDNEITMQVNHWVNFGIFKYLLPRWLWVSNVEKLSHPDAQRELMSYYEKVDVPVGLIHGDKDSLVPYENSPWLMNYLPDVEMETWEGKDHAIHFSDTDQLVDYMLNVPY
ncbi:MAG: pimeloyl-ACP methyl ester carboxylesterase, partial [Limisphaerales bacterium]